MGAAVAALSASFAACGGDDSSESKPAEAKASYPVEVVAADFAAEQRLGETTLLRLGVRNAGEKRMPALTVTLTIAGKEGETAGLPFAIRDPQPGLSQPERPVWVLSEHYPRLIDANGKVGSESAGTETGGQKTFEFGPQEAGETTEAVWKVSAVRSGRYELMYEIGAGLGGKAKAETPGGGKAGGSFDVKIGTAPVDVEVTDSGEVVEIDAQGNSGS